MIQAVTFDLWDTIYADDPKTDQIRTKARFEIVRSYIKKAGYSLSDDQLANGLQHAANESRHEWDVNCRTPDAKERLNIAFNYLDVQVSQEMLNDLVFEIEEVGIQLPPSPFPDAKTVLEALSTTYLLAIISDTGQTPGRVLRKLLEKDGLSHYFQVFTFSNEVAVSKPDTKVFQLTLDQLQVQPEHTIHVGDNPTKDIVGALRMGMRAIHLSEKPDPNYQHHHRYYQVQRIGHVLNVIKQIAD